MDHLTNSEEDLCGRSIISCQARGKIDFLTLFLAFLDRGIIFLPFIKGVTCRI